MKRNLQAFTAFLASLIKEEIHRYTPTRPSIIRVVEKVSIIKGAGKRRGPQYQMVERLIDNTRYPGEALRQIRKSGQARECSRRHARGCVQ